MYVMGSRRTLFLLIAACGLLHAQVELPAGAPSAPGGLFHTWRTPLVATPDLSNSNRLESLVRAGTIYLSLQDAIALALENNLDIAIERYGPLQAESDLRRTQAGGVSRGVPRYVVAGPLGADLSSGAAIGNADILTGVSGGPALPALDPVVQGQLSYGHTTAPQTSSFITGTSSLITRATGANFSLTQSWLTGTTGTLTFNNSSIQQNALTNNFNPYTTSTMDLLVTQHLLQGFGLALNNREIRVARNNLNASRLDFEAQVMNTVAAVINLYWDLVSFNEQVKTARSALAAAQKLYDDNRKQVAVGFLAPIAVVQAEAEVANRQQDVTVAETNVLEQETILKNALSKNGTASPSLADAHVTATDQIHVPDTLAVRPVQDLIETAMENRPDLRTSRINLDSAKIRMEGTRNALRPTLDAFAEAAGHGLSGQPNTPTGPVASFFTSSPDPYFIGGYSNVLTQLFRRNFPDYRVGLNFTVTLRNRTAQADYVRGRLDYDQSGLQLQKQINQIRVDVQNAVIALAQAHARYQAALKSRNLEEQTLYAEEKKYQAGVSTVYTVIQIQRDLTTARGNEVAAASAYIRARTNLDTVLGTILEVNRVSLDEALRGTVSRPPDAIPPAPQGAGGSK
jgi:outer membrane protein TolC